MWFPCCNDLPYNITSKLEFSDPGLGLVKGVLLKVECWLPGTTGGEMGVAGQQV